ncbi:MAG: OmpA family protein [Solirubrobacteraceae bacterium]
MSERHAKESGSKAWPPRAAQRSLALFALLLSLTLAAAPGADASAAAFIKAYGWGVADGASQFETCTSTCQTGLFGSGAGQLWGPTGVAIDPSGDVYVADNQNNRIAEFSAAGAFIKAYGWGVADGASQFETCTTTCQTGIRGFGAGQFFNPWGVAVDSSGDVYVTDYDAARIQEFSAAGAFIKAYGWGVADGASQFETCTTTCQTGIAGAGAGQLDAPDGVAVDSSGDVYVADRANGRIDEFSAAGAFVKAYGWGVADGASQFETCTTTCRYGLSGFGAGQLYNAAGVATNSSGDVYVTDEARIDEFSAAGAFVKAYGWGVADGASQFETCTTTCQTGLFGGGAGEFEGGPWGVATDSSGDVYVSDYGRIAEFSAAGAFIEAYGWGVADGMSQFEACTSTCQAGIPGGGAGQLGGAYGVATDSSGDVYVADGRIDEFSAAGALCVSAPSITTQPAAQTVTAPAAATFTADGSTPANCSAPGVQWSSEAPGATSFSPISGATSTSYTTPATTTAQSGTKYEATFATAGGSTTTSAATLTVVKAAGAVTLFTPPAPPAGGTRAPAGATAPDPIVKVLPPTAEAAATSTKATLGYQLSGKGTTAASGHKITFWVWKLGNKVVGRKETIDVKLPAYNTNYSYTLTVTQSGGETGSASVTVEETLVKGVTTKTVTTQLTVSSDTLFAWNSFALTARAKAELSAVRAVIKASRYVVISGYCDDTGDNDPVSVDNTYNVWLSTERALAVADFLYDNKIPKTTKLVGYGRTHFVATNATAAGRAENRRVTIQFE